MLPSKGLSTTAKDLPHASAASTMASVACKGEEEEENRNHLCGYFPAYFACYNKKKSQQPERLVPCTYKFICTNNVLQTEGT